MSPAAARPADDFPETREFVGRELFMEVSRDGTEQTSGGPRRRLSLRSPCLRTRVRGHDASELPSPNGDSRLMPHWRQPSGRRTCGWRSGGCLFTRRSLSDRYGTTRRHRSATEHFARIRSRGWRAGLHSDLLSANAQRQNATLKRRNTHRNLPVNPGS